MSLLLQALKKAEEAKRLREQASGAPEVAVLEDTPESSANHETLEFPALMEEYAAPEPSTTHIEPTLDLTLELAEPALPPIESFTKPAPVISLDFEPAPAPIPTEARVPQDESDSQSVSNPQTELAQAPVQIANRVVAPPVPPPPVAEEPPAPVAAVKAPIAPSIPVQESKPGNAARPLLSAPRAKPQRSMAPWLVLGGCILLSGFGAWFWWQFQALSTPVPPPIARAMPVASEPVDVAGSSSKSAGDAFTPALQTPASSPITAVSVSRSSASASIVAAQIPLRTAPPIIRPANTSRPPAGNKAAYIEALPIPDNLPKIERQTRDAAVPAALEAGWNAFQRGDLVTAESQYRQMLNSDARNRDALLGLAAIAARRGQKQDAAGWYKRLLTLNPQDDDAQSGLLATDPDALTERNEARLLQQSDRADSPLLLAQYYAAHNRWHEAQEQYFRAFAQDPSNADLAFNLAISLDHLSQNRLAADYYRKALALGKGSFDRVVAEKRLMEITAGAR